MKKLFFLSFLCCFYAYIYASYPQNYYNSLTGKTGADLKTALHEIICRDTSQYLNYGSGIGRTWQGFYSTDRDETNDAIVDMYSSEMVYFPADYAALGYKGFGGTVQIEHSVPKSWWKCNIARADCAAKDLHHLYPANGSINAAKSNHPLGVVTDTPTTNNGVSKVGNAVYDGYSGKVFEPADQYKGDFARAYFYVATAYEHYAHKWDTDIAGNMMQADSYPTLKTWAVNLLLQWHRQDIVSVKEQTRMDKVFAIQKNRNPFIDLPELVEYIWGNKVGIAWGIATYVENSRGNDVKIICNSYQNSITVQSDENVPANVYVYSVDGKLISLQSITTNTTISLPEALKGIYIVKVSTNNRVITQKVVF